MSYDVALVFDVKGKRYRPLGSVSYTSNVRDLLNAAFGVAYWVEAVDGKVAADAVLLLSDAISKMNTNRKEMETLAPKSKNGSLVGAIQFLSTIRSECYENPDLIIEIGK